MFVQSASLPWLRMPSRRTRVVEVREGVLLPGADVLVCGVPAIALAATDYRDGSTAIELIATPTFPLVASPDADLFHPGRRPIHDQADLP